MKRNLIERQNILQFISLIYLMFLASACSEVPVSQPNQTPHPSSTPVPRITTEVASEVVSESLWIQSIDTYKEIIEKANIIVVGKVIGTGWTFNAARNPDKVQEPAETLYAMNRIYEVNVDHYIKGDGPQSFYIFNSEGDAWGNTPEEMQDKVAKGEFQPMDSPLLPEIPYLMFLNPFDANNIFPEIPKGVYYSEVTDPWLFDISDPKEIRPVNSHSANPFVDWTLPFEQIVSYIQIPELIPPTPMPVVEPTIMNPYPHP
jgi:hypothetical protein